jgi:RING-variant domain
VVVVTTSFVVLLLSPTVAVVHMDHPPAQDFGDERISLEDNEDEGPDERELASMPPSEPFDSEVSMTCLRTGLAFQTSLALRLLASYDDGMAPAVALTPFSLEPVFCRICREGLHENADEEQPDAADDEREGAVRKGPSRVGRHEGGQAHPDPTDPILSLVSKDKKGPVQPPPAYFPNAEALRNPLLAPCECSGSMAFVHYLCVEQWRCRSRHPEAHHGLNCETCGKRYDLPPPSERPAAIDQEDWLEAMPPHVMQALRQPHLCWQLGAAIVRRRWLRPLAPVVVSPIVALYCRARRLLKKRGVARRRWACSLCRRRARWKCVRCLRSYYCSRQCQNVSWHIVHKHVCYKPSRFAQSVVFYGSLAVTFFPGILRDPFMYDLGLCLIPASFIIMAILGGGIGLAAKKIAGVDIRGRCLEVAVVLATAFLSVVSWGLVQGFFGLPHKCYGIAGKIEVTEGDVPRIVQFVASAILWPTHRVYFGLDALPSRSSALKAMLCSRAEDGCFLHLPQQDFYLASHNGQKCTGDLLLVTGLYVLAYVVFIGTAAWKHYDRMRRHGDPRNVQRGGNRPHQE